MDVVTLGGHGWAGLAWIWWDWAKEVRLGQTPLGRARQFGVQSDPAGWSEAGLMGGAGLRWAGMIWKGLN